MTTRGDGAPTIPDGGWGWVVVMAAFIHHVVTHGVFFSTGIVFTSLQDALDGSKAQIAWVVSIEIGSGFLSGPVTGHLISKYGAQIVAVVGSILGASGYVLSMFASNVYVLYVTMGLISGVGFGMISIAAILVVNEYFDKHRGLAAGISMAGTGVGALLFNPLLNWMMEKYGWRGSLLLLSAIVLNCIPAGLIYRPLRKHRRKKHGGSATIKCTKSVQPSDGLLMSKHSANGHTKSMEPGKLTFKTKGLPCNIDVQYFSSIEAPMNGEIDKSDKYELQEKAREATLRSLENDKLDSTLALNGQKLINSTSNLNELPNVILNRNDVMRDQTSKKDNVTRYQYSPIFTSNGGVLELTYDDIEENIDSIDPLLAEIQDSESKRDLNISYEIGNTRLGMKHYQKRKGLLGQFSLFKNMVFILTVVAQFMFIFGFYVPFVYLPDKSKQEGIDETNTVWVLSTMGIASIVGRIAFGYIADRPGVNRLLLYTSGFLISGVVTSLCPLYSSIWMLYTYAIVFGMFTGMVLGLTPVVLVDLLGLEILPATFGISCLFRGLASLLGSPCSGLLVDLTGDYTVSFVVAGMFMVSGTLLMGFAWYLKRREERHVTCDR